MTPPQPKLLTSGYEQQIYIGGDPEVFLCGKGGKIIGSERVISEKGIDLTNHYSGKIVRDGVQVEFVLPPFHCRATGASTLATAFRALRVHLLENFPTHHIDFRQVVEVDEDELADLSEKSRILGCAPSRNIYDPDARVEVAPDRIRYRSAGGHIHIGLNLLGSRYGRNFTPAVDKPCHPLIDDPSHLVKLLDVLVGNTCVLIDRDPQAVERRKVYGRAGEYRIPAHGLEYRVLSNFWLRSYPLASFVWGMARMATAIGMTGQESIAVTTKDRYGYTIASKYVKPDWDSGLELLSQIDIEKVRRAINENDFNLAMETWQIVRGFLGAYTGGCLETGDGAIPIVASTIEDFDYFLEKGLDHWFPKHQAMIRWLCFTNGHHNGWEAFLVNRVRVERNAREKAATPHKRKKAA